VDERGDHVFDGLLVDYARKRGAGVILRGIRAVSDYEYELQMALMNRKLEPRLETVFMLPGLSYSYLSSKLVREIARLGASLKGLVPEVLSNACAPKFRSELDRRSLSYFLVFSFQWSVFSGRDLAIRRTTPSLCRSLTVNCLL